MAEPHLQVRHEKTGKLLGFLPKRFAHDRREWVQHVKLAAYRPLQLVRPTAPIHPSAVDCVDLRVRMFSIMWPHPSGRGYIVQRRHGYSVADASRLNDVPQFIPAKTEIIQGVTHNVRAKRSRPTR